MTLSAPGLSGMRRWYIDSEPHVRGMLRRVFPGAPTIGTIHLDATPANCRDLEWFMLRYPLEVEGAEFLQAEAAKHREMVRTLEDVMGGRREPREFDLVHPLRDYQRQAVEVYLANDGLLVADELGLGKTAVGIGSFCEPSSLPAVVVTLTHLTRQWAAEIERFAPELRTHVAKKGSPYPVAGKDGLSPDVLVMNYHKLAGWADWLEGWAKSVVFDECQELRRTMSLKYGAAKVVARACTRRLGLSATPIYNYGDEMFNVMDVLSPGALGSQGEFLREWCTGWGGRYHVQHPAALGSHLREQFLMLRRTRAEVGRELPEVIRIPHTIDSDRRELAKVEGAAGELARLILRRAEGTREQRYVAAGQFDMLMRQATGLAKAPYVAEFVRMLLESEEKIVLAGWHREVYRIWEELLEAHSVRIAYYTGTENDKRKHRSFEAFTRGDAQVLFMSLRTGAGLEGLQRACNVIVFGELDWSPGVHEQCIGRLNRDGQIAQPVAYYLIADDGADPVIADVLGVKREQARGIVDPNAPLIEKLARGGADVKALAERFLETVT